MVPKLLEDHLDNEVRLGNIPTLEGNLIIKLGGYGAFETRGGISHWIGETSGKAMEAGPSHNARESGTTLPRTVLNS